MGVIFDLQAVQSPHHANRGIARYTLELARAIEKHHPGTIDTFVLNPGLGVPASLGSLVATGRVTFSDRVTGRGGDIFHMTSPFEFDRVDRLWPPFARRQRLPLVTTVYDLIPDIFSEHYLRDPTYERRYRLAQELVRRSERVHCISQCTADDVIERLEMPPSQVEVVGAAPSARFRPPASASATRAALRSALPSVPDGYVLYVGGFDYRKNIHTLLRGYAGLDEELRARHHLVVAYQLPQEERDRLDAETTRLGIADQVVFTGFVEDSTLVSLYQAAELFVFPSIYEGFGLPIAEAMACGAPVISAGNSALVELVTDEDALFDASDPISIRDAMARALGDHTVLERLRETRLDDRYTWRSVAGRTVASYEDVLRTRPNRPAPRTPRPRIAYLSPLPPSESGVADYSYRLLTELVAWCDIDAFVDGADEAVDAPPGVKVFDVESFERIESGRGGYDRVVYCIGNSTFHIGALKLLRRRPGVVIAHDVRLLGLYTWSARYRPDFVPDGLHSTVQRAYAGRVPPTVGQGGWIPLEEADRHGILLARDVISQSEAFFTHSSYSANLARLEAATHDVGKIGVLPFAIPRRGPTRRPGPEKAPVIVSFGRVDSIKQSDKVFEAFTVLAAERPDAHLALVGFVEEGEKADYMRLAEDLGLSDRFHLSGHAGQYEYDRWLHTATVAVQLRASTNGESSATVADCLAAGIPTVVTDLGPARELPDSCTVKVPVEISAGDLAEEVGRLLDDVPTQVVMRKAAFAYAQSHTFKDVAQEVYDRIVLGRRASPESRRTA